MPSKSTKQHNFMGACKTEPSKMKGKCPPSKVVNEFLSADKGKKFPKGT